MAAEVATAAVSGVASKVAESFYDIIQREISYVFKYKSYGEELRTRVEDLKNKRKRVEQAVKAAETHANEIYDDVKERQNKMNDLIERADQLVQELDEDNKQQRCFKGWFMCPNLASRRKFSIKAVNTVKEATDLLRAVGDFKLDAVSHPPARERTEFNNVVGGYQQFDSRMGVFRDVVKALKDSEFNIIGVYGMGGVGKTTLVKEVARKVKEDKLFDEVAMAEVTQIQDVKRIQDKIAFDLGLKLDISENEFERAAKLRRILKKKKRFLVIFDNIWNKLDLEAVGIPCGVDDCKRCTILSTSRSIRLLRNQMDSQKNFSIEVLSTDEAMRLFWNTVGKFDSTETISDFQHLAVAIVGKCGGLPIAIKTIAAALKNNKSLSIWRDALYQLSNANPTDIEGMDAQVFSSIKLSYKFLENEDAKLLFRICALDDGGRFHINDLVKYGIGFGLSGNVYYSMEAGRDRVDNLINILKESCLLLDGDTKDEVKMHDIIHAVAVSIAADSLMFNVKEVEDDDHWTEELQNVIQRNPTAISLPYREIKLLRERLECPNLKLFRLFETGRRLEIPDHLFDGMVELRVLDITFIRLGSLPKSLGSLIKLRTLCLDYLLGVIDVAIVGKLKTLEILSFQGSTIEQLPGEIGQLTRLKLLDLSNCTSLKVIAPNVISKLSRLEELYVGDSVIEWEKSEEGCNANASLVELKGLTKLTTLEIRVQHAQILPQDLVSVELKRFVISIGDGWGWYYKSETAKVLNVEGLDKNSYLRNNGMKMLLKTAEHLHLHQLNGFQNVVHELDNGEGFPLLKHLRVQDDSQISDIVNSVGVGQFACSTNIFPLLESLFLSKLNNLEKIWHGQLAESCQSFSKLITVEVGDCDKLKHLFSFSMAKNLLQLEDMQVRSCRSLKMIVEGDQESESTIIFTQLRSLKLKLLPELTRSLGFFDLERSQRLPATSSPTSAFKEIIAEDDLEVLFNNKVKFPTLEKLKLQSLNIKMIWVDHQFPAMSSSFQNLTKLTVAECSNLKFLFPHSVVRSLVNLQILAIRFCESMERVIENLAGLGNIRDGKQMIESMVFPKLEGLELAHLPKLTRFISMTESSSLSLSDTDTPSLFDGKVGLPCLEALFIVGLPKFRKTWQGHHQFEPDSISSSSWSSFSNLKFFYIKECDNLMNVFPSNTITGRGFERLEKLSVWECGSIEEIIEDEEETINSSSNFRFNGFPQLNSLELSGLPKLKTSIYWNKHL